MGNFDNQILNRKTSSVNDHAGALPPWNANTSFPTTITGKEYKVQA